MIDNFRILMIDTTTIFIYGTVHLCDTIDDWPPSHDNDWLYHKNDVPNHKNDWPYRNNDCLYHYNYLANQNNEWHGILMIVTVY